MLTRQASRRAVQTLRTKCSRPNVFFSTSPALGPRMRPGTKVSGTNSLRNVDDLEPPSASQETASKVSQPPHEVPQKHKTSSPSPSQPIGPISQQKSSSSPPELIKSVSIRGLKPHQQALYQHESICFQRGADSLTETTKSDKPPFAAAAKFFEEGCRLLYSAETFKHHRRNDHVPEIVVLGASNAGKSSFLNALVGRVDIARVSHKPGKTTTMNAYGIGPRSKIAKDLVRKGEMPPKHSLILMDTPGYGFKSRSDWGKTIMDYLRMRSMLRGAVLLLPVEKKLQDTDRWILRTLARQKTRTLVVLTKADKPGEDWPVACKALATAVQDEMLDWDTSSAAVSWREGSDQAVDIYATAANMGILRKLGNGAGMGGVRLAILEMAGFTPGDKVEQQPETKSYSGAIVSFDDVVWKTS